VTEPDSSIQTEDRSSDVGVSGETHYSISKLFGDTQSLKCGLLSKNLDHFSLNIASHGGGKNTRSDCADSHSISSKVSSHRQGHSNDSSFGRAIDNLPSLSLNTCDTGDVDQYTSLLLFVEDLYELLRLNLQYIKFIS
jgi:hypothetical protein